MNPHQFLDQATRCVRQVLDDVIVDGIKYEQIAGEAYEMLLFEEREIEGYLSRIVEVRNSIYEAVEFESEGEKKFALELDDREDIRLFIKLPAWFRVETPVGTYNPDWAIVKEVPGKGTRLYLVRETKGSVDPRSLRQTEQQKIRCGERHFDSLGVDFETVSSAREV